MEKNSLLELAHARDLAQKHLEERVKEEFSVGTLVSYSGVRGQTSGEVTGTDGELLILGKMRRHWEKVLKK